MLTGGVVAGAEQQVIEKTIEQGVQGVEELPPLVTVPETGRSGLAEALLEVATALNQGRGRQEVLEQIATQLERLVPYTGIMIGRADPRTKIVTMVFGCGGNVDKMLGMRVAYGEGLAGWVAKTGRPALWNRCEGDDPTLKPKIAPGCPPDPQQYVMVVPLCGPDRVEGTLALYREGEDQERWGDKDLELAQLFATQAQVAFHNAELYDEVQERARRLQAMNELLRPTSARLGLAQICRSYEPALRQLFPFTAAGICIRQRPGKLTQVWASDGVGWKTGTTLPAGNAAWWVIEHGRGYVIDNLDSDHGYGRHCGFQEAGAVSFVTAPLKARGRIFGVLGLGHSDRGAYDQHSLKLLEELAVYVAASLENAMLYQEVRAAKKDQGQLLAKLITAQEEERRALAADLHDDTIQSFAAGLMLVDRIIGADQRERRLDLTGKLRHTLQSAMERARKLMVDLRPPVLDSEGLVAALDQQLKLLRDEDGMVTELTADLDGRLDATVEILLFRSFQEALQNIRKHARASRVAVQLSCGPEEGLVTLTISDDGVGFDPPAVLPKAVAGGHLGLYSLLQRVELAGGRVDVTASPNSGTRLVVSVPSALGGTE